MSDDFENLRSEINENSDVISGDDLDVSEKPVEVNVVEGDTRPVEPMGYEPNHKFKVYDEEHEFEDFLKPIIKDKDTEAKVRALYEKAYGLDVVKPKYQRLKDEKVDLTEKYENLSTGINRLRDTLDQGNYPEFFKAMNIPDEKIYEYVMDKLKYQDMPPEQRQAYDSQIELKQKASKLEEENKRLNDTQMKNLVSQTDSQINGILGRDDLKGIVSEYDKRVGKEGAFKDAIWSIGETHYVTKQENLTPEAAINKMLLNLGHISHTAYSATAVPQITVTVPGTPTQLAVKQNATIPSIPGTTGAPVTKQIRDLDALRKHINNLGG